MTNLFKNTTPKGAQSQDPFWDQAAQMLLLALVFYLHYEAPPEERNFSMVHGNDPGLARSGRMMTPTNPRWMNSLTAWKCGTRSISP